MSAPSSPSALSRRARLEQWAPGLRVLRTYDRSWLPRDLVAGLILSALLIPQGMAYSELAGLPAITGLYTTVICLLAYARSLEDRCAGLGQQLCHRFSELRISWSMRDEDGIARHGACPASRALAFAC